MAPKRQPWLSNLSGDRLSKLSHQLSMYKFFTFIGKFHIFAYCSKRHTWCCSNFVFLLPVILWIWYAYWRFTPGEVHGEPIWLTNFIINFQGSLTFKMSKRRWDISTTFNASIQTRDQYNKPFFKDIRKMRPIKVL